MTRRTRLSVETLDERALPSFVGAGTYYSGVMVDAVATGDFNGDGKLDLVTANDGNNTVGVFLGNGDGTFQAPTTAAVFAPASVAVGDFNGDGKLDLAVAKFSLGVIVLLGKGDGTFQTHTGFHIDGAPVSVAAGDFNGDGRLDLGVATNLTVIDGWDEYGDPYSHSEAMAYVSLGNGSGDFSEPNVTDLGSGTIASATAADINGDAFDDLATVDAEYGADNVLLGDSSGYLQYHSDFADGIAARSVAAGDVNADGHTDLVTTDVYGNVGVVLGDGSGGFAPAVNYATDGTASSVVLGDFTGDGKLDVATTNSSSNALRVLYGNGDGTFSAPANFAAGQRPYLITAGDFNGDGWLDAATIGTLYTDNRANSVYPLINDHSWQTPSVPHVSINDVTVTEGNTGTVNATFTLSLSAPSSQPITVHYATADSTATAGSDYQAASGDVTFAPGQTSRTITVRVNGDRLPEANETYVVNLSGAANASIADGQGVGTILDDEPRISISDVTKSEGKKNQTTLFTFTVTLSAPYDQAVTMSFRTTDGTATTGDADYAAHTGTITFKPGETTKTITIEVQGDTKKESNEYFYLDLSGNSSNSLFTKNRGTGTILNDD